MRVSQLKLTGNGKGSKGMIQVAQSIIKMVFLHQSSDKLRLNGHYIDNTFKKSMGEKKAKINL